MKIYQNYYFPEGNNSLQKRLISTMVDEQEYVDETVLALMETALEITENYFVQEGAENA